MIVKVKNESDDETILSQEYMKLKTLGFKEEENEKKGKMSDIFNYGSSNKKTSYIVHSNHIYKIYWDVFIVFMLVFVCMVIPFRLTFIPDTSSDN